MRASGVRSSWLQLASSRRWAAISSSMRSAERLKLAASAATSSRPSTSTRAPRSPRRAARRRPSAARAAGRAGAPPDRRRPRWRAPAAARPPTTQRIGLGRSRTWRATSQRPSGSCRVKVGPPGPRRQPVRARRGSKRGGGRPAMAIRVPSGDRARGRSAACGAARRAPSAPRPAARRRRAAARRSARRRCRDTAASRSSASFHVSAAAPTNTASTSRMVSVDLEVEALHVSAWRSRGAVITAPLRILQLSALARDDRASRGTSVIGPGPGRRRSRRRARSGCAWASSGRPRSRRGCG